MVNRKISTVCLVTLFAALPAVALAGPQETYYEAYYLQHGKQDAPAALALYEKLADARSAPEELRADARAAAAACREAIAATDLAALFPAETLVYAEIRHPGGHLEKLLTQLGLVGTAMDAAADQAAATVRISPSLLKAFGKFHGVAVAVTGFNMMKQQPQWIAVIDAGDDDVVRGVLETAVATLGKPDKTIAGRPTFIIEIEGETLHVAVGHRLVFLSQQPAMVQQALARLADADGDSLARSEVLGPALADRKDAMLFVAVDFQKLQGLIHNLMQAGSGAAQEIAIARALVDFESFRSATFQAGVADDGLAMRAALTLEEDHHSLVLNLLRTPSLSRDSLRYVPHGTAAVLMAALGESGGKGGGVSKADTVRQFTGLDIAREFFANIQECSIFIMPPSGEAAARTVIDGEPIPDFGVVMTVRDPSMSNAIWTQLLGLLPLATGASATAEKTIDIAGQTVHVYEGPESVRIYFATTDDAMLIALNEGVIRAALNARKTPSDCILRDQGFEPLLKSLDDNTSKACLAHVGRCLDVAKQFMSDGDLKDVAPFEEGIKNMVASVLTRETPNSMGFHATVSGLPDVGKLLQQMGVIEMALGRGGHGHGSGSGHAAHRGGPDARMAGAATKDDADAREKSNPEDGESSDAVAANPGKK